MLHNLLKKQIFYIIRIWLLTEPYTTKLTLEYNGSIFYYIKDYSNLNRQDVDKKIIKHASDKNKCAV